MRRLAAAQPGARNAFFRAFNALYARVERAYIGLVAWMVRRTTAMMFAFGALIAVTLWGFTSLPTGFLPTEDQGYVISGIQLPDAASLSRTALVDREDEPDRRVHAGRRRLELVGRPLDPRWYGRRECRHVLRRLQALGGAR